MLLVLDRYYHEKRRSLFFLPVTTRTPLKFGPETLTSVTCARVRMQVADDQGRAGEGSGLGGVKLQLCDESFGSEKVVSAGTGFESGCVTEHGYALGRFIEEAGKVEVLRVNCHFAHLADVLQVLMEPADEHQPALFGRARCLQLPGPPLYFGFLEEAGSGFDLGGVSACAVLPHEVELLIAEQYAEVSYGQRVHEAFTALTT